MSRQARPPAGVAASYYRHAAETIVPRAADWRQSIAAGPAPEEILQTV
jgi:hypothetical protein